MALNPIPGGPGDDLLPGTPADDAITGEGGNDTIDGNGGQDEIFGGAGADSLFGDVGHDTLEGGEGDDTIDAYDGNDRVYAGGGADLIYDGYGNDRLWGEAGDDAFFGGHGEDWFYGGGGHDAILTGDSSNPGVSHVFGGTGNDAVYFSAGGEGEVDGGSGIDFLSVYWYDVTGPGGAITIRLTGPDAGASGNGLALAIRNMEILRAFTYTGDDSVYGGTLDDDIGVQLGANTVEAYGGNDRISYATGALNRINGGDGNDTLTVSHAPSEALLFTVTVTSATDNYGSVLVGIEHFLVQGYVGNDEVRLGAGDDTVLAHSGNDLAWGGEGRDYLSGEWSNDTLYGDNGHDSLLGDRGHDALYGGTGDDVLIGGRGRDSLWGGAGADEFRFSVIDEGVQADLRVDTVSDFEIGIDTLRIRVDKTGDLVPKGMLDTDRLSYGAAVGTVAQFVLVDGFADGASRFFFDSNGTGAGGETLLARLENDPALTAGDIFLI